ncbi:hypothetical protein [Pseudomonas viridiflava]|nr:hypothetical protein [Pseudomonas viridiflava]
MGEYRIYRIYSVDGKKAKLRVSEPLKTFAGEILGRIDPVKQGVRVDNISVSAELLMFGPEMNIEIFTLG